MFKNSDTVTATTGAFGGHPSFKGSFGAFAMSCRVENISSVRSTLGWGRLTEMKLKGMWYFDQNPRKPENIASPYNLEPKATIGGTTPPVWDSTSNRWKIPPGNGVFFIHLKNIFDFKPTELFRAISVLVEFMIVSATNPPYSGTDLTNGFILTLRSDIEIGISLERTSAQNRLSVRVRQTSAA